MSNSLKTFHTSASFEDAKKAVETLLRMKGWKYSFKELSEDFVAFKGKGFDIRVLKRYYGAQLTIRGKFSEDIYDEIRILLPDAQIFKETKRQNQGPILQKTVKRREEASSSENKKKMKLIGDIINLLMFLLFLASTIMKESSIGVFLAILIIVYLIYRTIAHVRRHKENKAEFKNW